MFRLDYSKQLITKKLIFTFIQLLDGSDHRGCCTQWGVPRRCLDWCRGEPVASLELCALAYTKPIVSCFHEGKGKRDGIR